MKAIIVAGGRGERLRPLTNNIPKPMIEVAGKPILEHIINLFKKYNITEFIISVCYLPDKITDYFGTGNRFGVKINYIYEDESHPLGTAGNIAAAKNYLDSTFIVTYADILRDLNIDGMIKFHKNKKAFATLNTYKRFGPNPKSMILFDENNKIKQFIERPVSELLHDNYVWSNGSFYIFEPEIFDFIPQNKFADFGKDVFQEIIKIRKNIYVYKTDGYFVDIGNIEKMEIAKKTYTAG